MIHFSINLPKYRLRIAVLQKRGGKRDRLLKGLEEISSVRVGSKISRIARLLAEHTRAHKAHKLFMANLAGVALIANIATPGVSAGKANEAEITTIPAVQAPVSTTVVRRFPIDGPIVITQGYRFLHSGIDIDGVTGDPIYPIMNGKVESTGRELFLGNTVRVEHPDGVKSVYAHLSQISVKGGQEVDTKTKLGEMGNTGRSFGDHLHFEVYKNGQHVNPAVALPQERTTQVSLPRLTNQ